MLVEVKNIEFGYNKKKIINNISASFSNEEIVGLIGPSGCGKSTFSRIIAGYLKAQSGEVLFDGKKLSDKGYCPIQLIYQHPEKAVNPKWKMKDILLEGWDIDKATLDSLGIEEDWLTRWPNELSGGELQRFCIARALGPNTKFIIADEMTTMLDAITQASIWEVIVRECKERKIGLLAVTHNHALANRICDRIIDFEELNSQSQMN